MTYRLSSGGAAHQEPDCQHSHAMEFEGVCVEEVRLVPQERVQRDDLPVPKEWVEAARLVSSAAASATRSGDSGIVDLRLTSKP